MEDDELAQIRANRMAEMQAQRVGNTWLGGHGSNFPVLLINVY